MTIPRDMLWKAIIEDFFEAFCHYFFPEWAKNTPDFSKKPEFLDKELDELYPKGGSSKRFADKLVKVFTKKGEEQWMLIHIEVQGYKDTTFPERMFTYFHRIRDRHRSPHLMALAILTDADRRFKPEAYTYRYEKTEVIYRYEVFKLLEKSEQELDIPGNPFSIVMLTAKKALEGRNRKDGVQMAWKRALVTQLREADYSDKAIRRLLDFIQRYVVFEDPANTQAFEEFVSTTFKHRKNMGMDELVLMYERKKGIEEGIEKGMEKGKKEVTIKGIQKALQQGLSVQQICIIFEVSEDFVQQVQRSEVG